MKLEVSKNPVINIYISIYYCIFCPLSISYEYLKSIKASIFNEILYIFFKETTISLHTLLDFISMYKYVGCENIFFLLCKKIFLYKFNAIAQACLVHSVYTNG